jgi:CRP-like cAMP-binding protein
MRGHVLSAPRRRTATHALAPSHMLVADWALMTLTTVGYGDITPTNDLERVYALVSLLIGALVFGYVLSEFGSLIGSLDNHANMVEEKLDQMQEVIRHTNLPPELAGRIRSYTEYYFSKQSVYHVDEVLQHLTPSLLREVRDVFLNHSVDMVPLLRVYSKPFKLELVTNAFRPLYKEEAEQIIGKGDRLEDLFFLRRGEVHAFSARGRHLFGMSELGRSFDEHCLLATSCPYKYVAETRCECFVLPVEKLAEAVSMYLNAADRMRLQHDVVKEACKKSRMRWINLRVLLGELRTEMDRARGEGQPARAEDRVCAALCVQTYWFRRRTHPSAYSELMMVALWGGEHSNLPPAQQIPPPNASAGKKNDGRKSQGGNEALAADADIEGKLAKISLRMQGLEQVLQHAASEQAAKTKRDILELKEQNAKLEGKLDSVLKNLDFVKQLCQDKTKYSA